MNIPSNWTLQANLLRRSKDELKASPIGLSMDETRFLAALNRAKPLTDSSVDQAAYGRMLIERVWGEYMQLKQSERAVAESSDEPRHTLDCSMVRHPNCTRCDCGSTSDPHYSSRTSESAPASAHALAAPSDEPAAPSKPAAEIFAHEAADAFRKRWRREPVDSRDACWIVGYMDGKEAGNRAEETPRSLPGDSTRRAAFNEWWQMMRKGNDPQSSPGWEEQMRAWSMDAWQAGAAHERDRIGAMRANIKHELCPHTGYELRALEEKDIMQFIGGLSGDSPELRAVEAPELLEAWRRFKEAQRVIESRPMPAGKISPEHGVDAGQSLIVSAEEARHPLAFRHWFKDECVPYRGCHCGTCTAVRAAVETSGKRCLHEMEREACGYSRCNDSKCAACRASEKTSGSLPERQWSVTYDVIAYDASYASYGMNCSKEGFQTAEEAIMYAKSLDEHLNARVIRIATPGHVAPVSVQIWPIDAKASTP